MLSRTLVLSLLPISTLAHFHLVWPPSRGFDEDKIVDFPCGGFDSIETTRTAIPLNGQFPIQLNMEHTAVKGQVNIALGNDPGVNYNITLKPTFQETGPDNFCIGGVVIPGNLGITEGMNATIQVLTNGDPNGGLYQCTDVTFTSAALSQSDYNSHCQNSTGVTASFVGGSSPNGTSGSSSTASSSAGTASSASSKAFAAQKTVAPFVLGAMGLIGGLAVL